MRNCHGFRYAEIVVSPELISYITTQRTQGLTADQIRPLLSRSGWKDADIDQAFAQLGMTPAAAGIASMPSTIPPTVPAAEAPVQKKVNLFDFKHLKWYEWLALLPAFLLLTQGGALGGLVGFTGWSMTLKFIRKPDRSLAAKIMGTIGFTILYYVVFFIGAIMVSAALHGMLGR